MQRLATTDADVQRAIAVAAERLLGSGYTTTLRFAPSKSSGWLVSREVE